MVFWVVIGYPHASTAVGVMFSIVEAWSVSVGDDGVILHCYSALGVWQMVSRHRSESWRIYKDSEAVRYLSFEGHGRVKDYFAFPLLLVIVVLLFPVVCEGEVVRQRVCIKVVFRLQVSQYFCCSFAALVWIRAPLSPVFVAGRACTRLLRDMSSWLCFRVFSAFCQFDHVYNHANCMVV